MFTRYTHRLRLIVAMIGSAGLAFGSGSLVRGDSPAASSADELEIRVADSSSVQERGEGGLVFRSARRPVVVPISFGIVDGGPRIQADASEVVLEQLREHPRRLITISVEGLPMSFKDLPRSTRGKLMERGGPEFPDKYDRFVARELARLLDEIRSTRPKSPIAIQGLPFDGDGRNDVLSNERFASVFSRLSAFVLERGVVVSSRSDEQEIVSRLFPNAIGFADGRAVIYPLNLGWRLVIKGESLASSEAVDRAEMDQLGSNQPGVSSSSRLGSAAPMMSDLDELGVAGRGGGRPAITGRSSGGSVASGSG